MRKTDTIPCEECNGLGWIPSVLNESKYKCNSCNGTGETIVHVEIKS